MEFDIIDIIKYYFKNYIIVGIIIFISILIGMFYCANIYRAEYIGKTTIMLGVNEINDKKDYDVYLNDELVKNYIELMKSDKILVESNKLSNLDYDIIDLKKMINIYEKTGTQYITIEVTSKNNIDCQKLSLNIYKALQKEVKQIFNTNNIYLIDSSKEGILKHNRFYYLVIFIFFGIVLSVVFITFKFLFFKEYQFTPFFKDIYKKIISNNKEVLKKPVNKKMPNNININKKRKKSVKRKRK